MAENLIEEIVMRLITCFIKISSGVLHLCILESEVNSLQHGTLFQKFSPCFIMLCLLHTQFAGTQSLILNKRKHNFYPINLYMKMDKTTGFSIVLYLLNKFFLELFGDVLFCLIHNIR